MQFTIVTIFIVLISACAQQAKDIEPTQNDIVIAIKNEIDNQNKKIAEMTQSNPQMARLANKTEGGLETTFVSAQKLACAKANNAAGFNCDVALEVIAPMVGKQKANTNIRFVKNENNWIMISLQQ